MKKHGRRIRKSYFPNLFFKQDLKSSGQENIHVSVHIRYAFHNYRFSKNFPLSYQKEKAHGISEFPLKFKVFCLKKLKPANEKNIFLNFISKKPEPLILYKFTSPELTSPNLKYPEPVTHEYISFNFAPLRLIDRKLTGCNPQISNLRALNPDSSEFGYLNYFSVGSTFPNFKILKLKFFENNRKVYNETLRKSEELRHLDRNILDRAVLTIRSNSEIKGFRYIKNPRSLEILFAPLSKLFNPKSLEQKPYAGQKNVKAILRRQYTSIKQLKTDIWENQQTITTKEKHSLIEIKEKQHKLSKAIFCNHKKNKLKKFGFTAKSLANPLIPVIAENGLPRKIQNELLRKIEQLQFLDKDFLFRVEAPVKKSFTKYVGFKTSDELPEPLNRHFNLYSLRRKLGFNKEAVKSLPRKKYSDAERSKLRIRKKQDIIERKAEQEHRELLAFRKVRNMSLLPSVQFLIPNFREKTAFLLDNESLTEPGNPELNQSIIHQQRKAVLPYSDKKIKKTLSTGRKFLAKTIARENIPGKFSKNLLIFQKTFFNEDTPSFPDLYIQQSTSKLTTLTRNSLLDGNNGIFRAGVPSHGAVSTSGDHKSKRFMGLESSERNFFARFNVFQQYLETISEVRTGNFEKMFAPLTVETNKNLKFILKLSSYLNQGSKIWENTVIRTFNYLTTLTHNLIYNISTGFHQNEQRLQPDPLKVTPEGRKASSLSLNKTVLSQLNWKLIPTLSSMKAYQLNRKEKLNLGNAVAFQLNQKGKSRLENKVFSPDFHLAVRQTCMPLNYEKLRSIFYIFRYLEASKLTSELTRMTTVLTADYQSFDPRIADYAVGHDLFESHITDYILNSHLSDHYLYSGYAFYNKKIDSKREQNQKNNPAQKNKMKSTLNQHLLFKSLKIIAYRLKWAKAILFKNEKNKFKKAGFAAASLTHSLTPVHAVSEFPSKIQNKFFGKIAQIRHSELDFLFHEDAPAKRSGTETTGFKTSDELMEPLSRLFNLYNLKRKSGISKEAVKSLPRRKHLDAQWPKLRIWEKHDLIERKAEQIHGELPAFGKIRNMSLPPSVQFLIQNFLEKTAFLLDYESLIDTENPLIGQNLTYQQRKDAFPYSDKKIKKILSTRRMFSAKKTITGKHIPGNFVKNLLIFQSAFLKEDTSGFPVLYIQQLTSKPISLIRNRLLHPGFRSNFFPKGSLSSTTVEPQRLCRFIMPLPGIFDQTFFKKVCGQAYYKKDCVTTVAPVDHADNVGTCRFRSNLLRKGLRSSLFVKGLLIRNTLLASNKEILSSGIPIHGTASTSGDHKSKRSMGRESSERRFFAGFPYFFQQYPEITFEVRGGSFEKTSASSIVETNKNLQSVLKSSSYQDQKSNDLSSLESTFIHIFNRLTALTHKISTGFQQNEQRFQPDRLKITAGDRATFTIGGQETLKPESSFFTQYSYLETKPASRQLPSGFNVHRSLVARNKLGHTTGTFGIYGVDMSGSPANPIQENRSHSRYAWIQKSFKLPEVLLPSRITDIGGENPAYPQKIPLCREKENIATYTLEQSLIQFLSLTRAQIFKNPVASLNSQITNKQSYPSFFKSLSVLPKKETLEYSRILDLASRMNTPVTTENRSILIKIPNLILANSLSSNIFLSDMPPISALIPLLSRTIGIASGKTVPVYNLLKSAYSLRSASFLKSVYSLKSASSIIFQNPVFAEKFGVPSNAETKSSSAEIERNKPALRYKFTLRYEPDSISQYSWAQKSDGQKVSRLRTARMNLSPEGGKQRSANTGNFLQRRSLDSLERKNSKLRVNKNIDIPAEAQMRQRLFSDSILSSKYDFIKGMKQKKITSTTYKPEKNPEKMQDTFNGFLFRSKIPKASILKSSEKTASSRIHLGPESFNFVFSRAGGAGKPSEFTAFGPSVKGRSKLKYAKGSNRKTEREDLVYGISEPLLEEVKKIKKIIFETRKIIADHLESHSPQVTGTAEEGMDIEYISEKIMQAINHRLKIEAERRGIF